MITKRTLDLLCELSRQEFKCSNEKCEEYEKYNQCMNHSYILCPIFEDYRVRMINNRVRK